MIPFCRVQAHPATETIDVRATSSGTFSSDTETGVVAFSEQTIFSFCRWARSISTRFSGTSRTTSEIRPSVLLDLHAVNAHGIRQRDLQRIPRRRRFRRGRQGALGRIGRSGLPAEPEPRPDPSPGAMGSGPQVRGRRRRRRTAPARSRRRLLPETGPVPSSSKPPQACRALPRPRARFRPTGCNPWALQSVKSCVSVRRSRCEALCGSQPRVPSWHWSFAVLSDVL